MEENPDEVPSGVPGDDRMLINFPKHFMIYRSISSSLGHISAANWNIDKEDTLYSYCYELPFLQESEQYQLSLLREPRENN